VPIREIEMEIPAKRILFSNSVLTHDRDHFCSSYAGSPPWDIGKPQPAFEAAADKVVGSVLDAGCGTGEHALFFAARGHAVTGFDFLEEPIAAARRKAAARSLIVKFLVKDALKLHEWTHASIT
jgi:2-polyprenyl-3-methyl-5-hydroxy-6-metoxy-1,4-benzoquinol methylase